ncbi:thiol-disulfide oxidoreductase DCC family protein [Phycisphaera mikurensis]|uniref:Thiol-disulfide oxidoreductase DCC n=1 Tax=Phycisphaera mikurensis (strain NBRC 102666 / KCTC 22515 / FYK2301M01) TaxID=1142394 RepID=I0IE78_PHYMF|nr:DCC1-like thiol-disulfide oxidoreductase family protein [Phycisphaera mikurensis]MBB6441368.1 putative DCC family thiol-disulfide oxidoreductase YuxK [Phycisphaera mikurensis]BAM03566.1 hypothetical protein PSMK_14070 [Phycisphaera mikurensis NBRC 102666]
MADLEGKSLVFYDGHCGLCHRWVRFVLPRDPADRFVFTPLQGDTIQEVLTERQIAGLPDSIVLRDPDGTLHTRSDAVLRILRGVGGGWALLAALGRVVPRSLRDLVYDGVARIRHRVFGRPAEACPMMPARLRHKFVF